MSNNGESEQDFSKRLAQAIKDATTDEILYTVEVEKKIAGDKRYNFRNVKIRIEATSGHNFEELAERLRRHLDLASDYTQAYLEELKDDDS